MDADRQIEQCMGNDVSERTRCVKCETVSSGGANLLWSTAAMLGRSCGICNITEARRGRQLRETLCDPYGENLVKATLPGGGSTCHHNGINLQLHRIFRQSGMTRDMEDENYFLRKVREMAINPV